MKSFSEYLALPYTYVINKNLMDHISVKEFPGCMSVGDTITESHEMIQDVMGAWMGYCLDEQIQISEPEEETLDDYSGKFIVRISPTLHKKLAEGAKKHGVSMNHYTSEHLPERCALIANYEKLYSQLLKAITKGKPSLGEYRTAEEKQVPFGTAEHKKGKK